MSIFLFVLAGMYFCCWAWCIPCSQKSLSTLADWRSMLAELKRWRALLPVLLQKKFPLAAEFPPRPFVLWHARWLLQNVLLCMDASALAHRSTERSAVGLWTC